MVIPFLLPSSFFSQISIHGSEWLQNRWRETRHDWRTSNKQKNRKLFFEKSQPPTTPFLPRPHFVPLLCFFFLRFHLFWERWEEREKGRYTWMCGCLLSAPYWGPGLQPRHVPWLGIKLVTLWFSGQCSVHWATPARALYCVFYHIILFLGNALTPLVVSS